MPSSVNSPALSVQLHFKKTTGKWTRRLVELKKSSDANHKYYLDINRPNRRVTRAITRKFSLNSVRVEISVHSHAIIRDTAEDNNCRLLSLLSLKKTKQPCYQFAAYDDQEKHILDNLANSIEKICEITSFEMSVDTEPNSSVPSGPALLHIYQNKACLTSRSPCIRILKQWELVQPLAEFQWERHGLRISDHDHCNQHCFLFVHSQEDIARIKQKVNQNCKKIYSRDTTMVPVIDNVTMNPINIPKHNSSSSSCLPNFPAQQYGSSSGSGSLSSSPSNERQNTSGYDSCLQINDEEAFKAATEIFSTPPGNAATVQPLPPSPTSEGAEGCGKMSSRRRSTSNTPPIKEQVHIRYPGHQATHRCNSDPTMTRNTKVHSSLKGRSRSWGSQDNKNHELAESFPQYDDDSHFEDDHQNVVNPMISYPPSPTNSANTDCTNSSDHDMMYYNDIHQQDLEHCYANIQLRPKFYMYMNLPRDGMEELETPSTYVNIFSGSSFKGCYENWQFQRSIYSTIPALLPPPLPPKPSPPKLPPRRHFGETHDGMSPKKPPPRPPKPRVLATSHLETCGSSRIQVALFAATPVIGRVWFLRVAFMHQDANDTTFKRVKDIEGFSNHRLLKTNSLEVATDITMDVTVQPKQGFELLNGNQQIIELNDIQDLRKGDWFVVEFHIQNSDSKEDHLIANVSIGPTTTSTCRRICKANMGIDEVFQRKHVNPASSDTSIRQSFLSDYNKRLKLCQSLDLTIYSQGSNWRQVAGSLGFTHAEIMQLQDKACRNVQFSPTDEVLKLWEQREPQCSLEHLVNILRELGRLDIVQDLGYSISLES